jgi:hypothetical protein
MDIPQLYSGGSEIEHFGIEPLKRRQNERNFLQQIVGLGSKFDAAV